jgi:hypothetical protein
MTKDLITSFYAKNFACEMENLQRSFYQSLY